MLTLFSIGHACLYLSHISFFSSSDSVSTSIVPLPLSYLYRCCYIIVSGQMRKASTNLNLPAISSGL